MLSMRVWSRLLRQVVDLVVPQACLSCDTPGVLVCADCDSAIRATPGRARVIPAFVGAPLHVQSGVMGSPELLRVITAFKDGGRSEASSYLGTLLGGTVSAPAHHLVVPVPQSPGAYRRRGWFPLRDIARAANLDITESLTLRARHVDQASLSADERWSNVAGSMWVPPRRSTIIAGKSVIVFDDVITTGATMVEAARALYAAGARYVSGVTVAAMARRWPTYIANSQPPHDDTGRRQD
ncbi:unannotated protein [freshwater metagenome]|uniref:Unannotated protein n=1 Tax=freshwater metagenome TaxID=449393 RepID=A0A6J7FJ02_9ZZZZ